MKKVNKKGFVLAEAIVISVVVISALLIIYLQFSNLNNSYYRSLKYNNVDKLYLNNQLKKFIAESDFNAIYNDISGETLYIDITNCSPYFIEYMYCENLIDAMDASRVIITKNDTSELIRNIRNYDFSENMKDYIKNSKTREDGYRIIVEYNDGSVSGISSLINTRSLENALEKGDYVKGQNVIWAGLEWYVIEDNGDNTTLILKENYDIGSYGETTNYNNSLALNKLNTEFVNSNVGIQNSIQEGSIIQQDSNYVRLPRLEELGSEIPNQSNTAFWTMSSNGNRLYLGAASGQSINQYFVEDTQTYYDGYATSLATITKTGATSVRNEPIMASPTESSITYNLGAVEVNHSTVYAQQVNITAANAAGYSCNNSNCPNSFCGSRKKTYYTDSCETSTFTYYVVSDWWNPNYNVNVSGSSCGSNKIYYANGSCTKFYDLTSTTSSIGYRPVVTVYEKN